MSVFAEQGASNVHLDQIMFEKCFQALWLKIRALQHKGQLLDDQHKMYENQFLGTARHQRGQSRKSLKGVVKTRCYYWCFPIRKTSKVQDLMSMTLLKRAYFKAELLGNTLSGPPPWFSKKLALLTKLLSLKGASSFKRNMAKVSSSLNM